MVSPIQETARVGHAHHPKDFAGIAGKRKARHACNVTGEILKTVSGYNV
jgi:hypothetical protein